VRSQEDGVDVLQCPAFRFRGKEIEDDNRQRVGANVNLRRKSALRVSSFSA
jgi:hypothetical protein